MSHAELSPSGHHRWGHCPGSVNHCRGIERADSTYSLEGTFAHEVGALCLLDGSEAATRIGMQSGNNECDAGMAENVQVYLDAVRSVLALNDGKLLVEQKVVVNEDVYGTGDALIFMPKILDVFDLKYGQGVFVSAEGNPQLHDYGLGALRSFPELTAEVETVRLNIVQPRCNADRLWRSSTVSRKWLETEWAAQVDKDIAATKAADAPLIPGDYCQFCPGKSSCPALREKALTTARSVFKNLDEPAVKPPSPANLTPEQIAVVMDGKDLLETWLKSCVEMATDYAMRGELPRWKMVAKQGLRKWNDEGVAAEALRNARVEPFAEPKLISPAQAEKLLAKTPLGKKGGEALVEKLAHKPITGESLVPVSDPRPAITAGHPFVPLTAE